MMGKGDKRRPEDQEAFSKGYEKVFGNKKPQRGRFIWDEEKHKFIAEADYVHSELAGYYVQGDIEPYRSTVTGEIIGSRSTHREHLKAHGLIEVGNETKYLKQKPRTPPPGLKQTLIEVANEKLRYK